MPAASYVSTPIERSLAFVKNTSSPNSVHGYMTNKFANVDHTAHAILSTSLDFIKYDKPSVKFDIKSKYHTLSSNDINANISSICSTYSKTKLSLNNVSSAVSNEKKSSSKDASSNSGKCLLPKPKEVLYSPNKIVLGWQGRVPVGAGLVNAINTCYLNSCLQALFHIPSFHHWLLNDTDHQHQCEKQGGSQFECLVCAMRKTLNHCQSKSGGAIRPELIIKKLKLIARHLEHHRQEDSHEFLTYLIDGMHKSYLKAIPGSNKLDSYSKETTPLYQLFGSYLRTEVTCNVCSHVSTSYTHGTELSLDIRQASSLDEALAHFFAKESLSGDNLYRCEPCGRSVEATKRFRLESPPNVLRLQLKRFNYHGFKNSRSVLVPILLDFGKYMHPPHLSLRPSSSGLKYKLVSAVIHHGSSPDSGHYTCIGSTSSGTYHYFDDEMVRASNLHQLTNAYVVMYELLPSSAASLHSSSSPGTPGMASTSASSPRKMIGPLLPPHAQATGPAPSKSAPPPTTISSAVHSTVDISTITHNNNNNSHTGGKSNGNFTNGSKFVNGSYAGPTTSKLVNGSSSPSPTKAVNGKTYSGGASAASSKLLNGVSKGPAVTPSKLPSPAFLKNGHGDARKPNGGVTVDSNGDARRSMPDLSCAANGNGTPPVKSPVANGFSKPAAGGESRWNGRDEKKGSGGGGAVSSAAARSGSPVRADKAAGATNGRDSPSSNRNGLKRAKLVDYESDEEPESAPGDVMDRRGGGKRPRAAPDARNGWKVLGTSSEKEEGSPSVGTRGEVRVAAGMQWSVVPVTPPANKTTTPTPSTPSFDAIALGAGTFPSTPSPSPSLTPSPSPSSSVAPSSPSSVASSGGGRCSSSSHYFVSSLSAAGTGGSSRQNGAGVGVAMTTSGGGVSEYLSRRNMSGDSSYGSNNVTSWSNEPSTLVQTVQGVQPQSRFPRHNAGGDREEDEEEMDRGRVKKVKSQQHNNSKYPNNGYYNKPGHNPFTHYQQHHNNNNRKSYYNNSNNNNNNGGHDKYHYNKYPHYNNKSRQYRHQPYHHRRY